VGEHVVLHGDLSPSQAEAIQREADGTVRGVSRFLGLAAPDARITILLFGSKRSLKRHLSREAPHLADAAGACFVRGEELVVAVARRWRRGETFRYLRHELVHCVLAAHYDRLPPWINEGLAQFFERGRPYGEGGKGRPGELARRMRDGEATGFSRMVALPEGAQLSSLERAAAQALVRVLLTDKRYGAEAVRDYMTGVNGGADAREQFRKSFGMTIDEVERGLATCR